MRAALPKSIIGLFTAISVMGFTGSALAQDDSGASDGRRIYNSYCFLCHGASGIGGGLLARKLQIVGQVADITQEQYSAMDDADLANLIAGYDREESLMPKWGEVLGQEELASVAAYVKRLGPQASYQLGKNLYYRHCASCHGSDAKGGGAIAKQIGAEESMPDLSADSYRSMSTDAMAAMIKKHKSANDLTPQFDRLFTDRALNDLAYYLVVYSPSGLPALGNAANGEKIFRQNCGACHGAGGKGDGVLANLLDVPMVDLTSASQLELSDMQIVHTISQGKGTFMPAWFGELNQYEVRDVAAYIRTLYKPGG